MNFTETPALSDTAAPQATILFHAPNRVGLGHLTRLSSIALAIRRTQTGVRPLFAIEGSGHVLLDVMGLPYLPLPSSYSMYKTECWAQWTEVDRRTLSKRLCRAIVKSVNPQLAVFDCFPSLAMVDAAVRQGTPVVLCLREMMDMSKYLAHIDRLLPYLALILIPHDPGTFEPPPSLHGKCRFVGQVVRPFADSRNLRSNIVDHPRIIITGGGGGFRGTASFYNLAMKAFCELRFVYPSLDGRLIVGPLFQEWTQLQVAPGITVVPFEADMMRAFSEADLVISAAGYNSVAEVEQVGVRGILVPSETNWDDQHARASRSARLHPHIRRFEGTDPEELACLAKTLLTGPPGDPVTAGGAEKAAALLCSMLMKPPTLREPGFSVRDSGQAGSQAKKS
jgi:UDP-N-acetylglucosamine--N-acetylmuramyl-(pentapeptide) pyrophosphoryl-undecaprenol N-acetylglucosamine transferase